MLFVRMQGDLGTDIGHRYIEVVLDVSRWIVVVDVVLKHEIRFSRLYS